MAIQEIQESPSTATGPVSLASTCWSIASGAGPLITRLGYRAFSAEAAVASLEHLPGDRVELSARFQRHFAQRSL